MDQQEMEAIWKKHRDSVYRLALAYSKNRADAEDITSDVFYRRFTCKTEFADEKHETAWLMRVTVNCAKDLLRSFRRRFTVPLEEADAVCETPEEHDVYCAVTALPLKYRTVVHLYYFEGYSVREIGGILGRSETAVQTQLARARTMLKKALGEELAL